MVINELGSDEVINFSRMALGLPPRPNDGIDEVFIAASLRRLAGFMCPCTGPKLKQELLHSIVGLCEATEELDELVENVIDKLTICGELVELKETGEDGKTRALLHSVPPSFTMRPNGYAILIGITGDEIAPFGGLNSRVEYDGVRRMLKPLASEELIQKLLDIGLNFLNEKTWLELPDREDPSTCISRLDIELNKVNVAGGPNDIIILDSSREVLNYKGRWSTPGNLSGRFIAKRPQSFGGSIWCYVELAGGIVNRFVDIPIPNKGPRQRSCDIAWRAQMAIDALKGTPQRFRMRESQSSSFIDFLSPIPMWAERKLIAVGSSAQPEGCLFSYRISNDELTDVVDFLTNFLWLKST